MVNEIIKYNKKAATSVVEKVDGLKHLKTPRIGEKIAPKHIFTFPSDER